MSEWFCRAEALQLSYGGNPLCTEPWAFEFPRGALTALIGPNGAGKSTLLRALLGEPVVAGGSLFLAGFERPVSELRARQIAEGIAFVPQETVFPAHLRLRDFLCLAFLGKAGLFGALPHRNSEPIDSALTRFGLLALGERSLGEISTGERQRAFLARALLQEPRILLLDEPTNHLDPGATHRFWESLFQQRARQPFETLMSTHDLAMVKQRADWICALGAGDLVFNGPKDEFFGKNLLPALFGIQ